MCPPPPRYGYSQYERDLFRPAHLKAKQIWLDERKDVRKAWLLLALSIVYLSFAVAAAMFAGWVVFYGKQDFINWLYDLA